MGVVSFDDSDIVRQRRALVLEVITVPSSIQVIYCKIIIIIIIVITIIIAAAGSGCRYERDSMDVTSQSEPSKSAT